MENIKIVDMPMGRGKTQAAIRYLIDYGKCKKIIYVTPFLKEIERVKKEAASEGIRLYEPNQKHGHGSKHASLMKLIAQGENIATTHALLECLTANDCSEILKQGYILILDETIDVINAITISARDLKALIAQEDVLIEFNNKISLSKDYDGNLINFKEVMNSKDVFIVDDLKNCKKGKVALIKTMLPEVWISFNEVFILTYRFEYDLMRAYFDFYKIPYEYWEVKHGMFEYGRNIAPMEMPRIDIYDGHLNDIGKDCYALSKSHFNKNRRCLCKMVKSMLHGYLRNSEKAKSIEILWTCYKEHVNKLKGNGYTKGFLACNARATNEYQNRTVVAYPINRFIDPKVKLFFQQNNIVFDEEQWALSELLQFLFRSALRKGKPIKLYIPSSRMRGLLNEYIVSCVPKKTSDSMRLFFYQGKSDKILQKAALYAELPMIDLKDKEVSKYFRFSLAIAKKRTLGKRAQAK